MTPPAQPAATAPDPYLSAPAVDKGRRRLDRRSRVPSQSFSGGRSMMRSGVAWVLLAVAACDKPFLHSVKERQPPTTAKLAWGAPPYFEPSCQLIIPGEVTFD